MPDVVIAGAGVVGLAAALLLAKDHHRVTVLERDRAAPAQDLEAAWTSWRRRGVSQFRQLHYFQPRFRAIIEAELPDVAEALDRAGALRFNQVQAAPAALSAGGCPGDEAFTALTARRPVVDSVLARVAADAPGITVRRGVTVTRLITGTPAAAGVCHVAGVGLPGYWQRSGPRRRSKSGRIAALCTTPATSAAPAAPYPRCSGQSCRTTGRSRRSPCRPTTAPGAWA
jgi:2-polyprenyl-6-methoxyphenol hydroxylase-like FAD-dependent oxidoreductase